jgi:CubicO group peptidase (beta-lactamase class C family)
MVNVVTYHNRSQSDHATFAATYLPKGYKYQSISIYGPPAQPLYAGVLTDGFAPGAQVEVHGMNLNAWTTTATAQAAAGRRPVMVVATGPADQAVYAAVFEAMDAIPVVKLNLQWADFDDFNGQAFNFSPPKILSWTSVYGTADDTRYIGIWVDNPSRIVWNVVQLAPDEDKQWFDASVYQWARRVFSVYAPDIGQYVSLYRDDAPTDFWASGAMGPDEYKQQLDAMRKQGYVPTCVQGAGVNNVFITATFKRVGSTGERSWSTPLGPQSAASLGVFDAYMQSYMRTNRVRAGALAVVKDTRLVLVRGYTCAEAGYPMTYPDSIFRIASCSKLITAVAILQLVEQGLIALDTPILGLLPFTLSSSTPGYGFIAQITVDHLLSMISGYDQSMWQTGEEDVAKQLGVAALPITKRDRARAAMQRNALTRPPGTSEHYCDLGYSLLSMAIEKVSGQSYVDHVRSNILEPLGISRAQPAVAATDAQPAGAVVQHDLYAQNGHTVLTGNPADPSRPFVPYVYGGTDYSTWDGFGGWCMAAVDYAAFLAVMNLSPCPYFRQPDTQALLSTQNIAYSTTLKDQSLEDPGWARGWSIDTTPPVAARWWGGTSSDIGCFFSLDDNRVGIVCFMNTDTNNIDSSYRDELRRIANNITDWGTDDFFGAYGLTIRGRSLA